MSALALALALSAPAAAGVSWQVSAETSAVVGQEARVVYRPAVPAAAALAPDALGSTTTGFAVVAATAGRDGSWTWTILPLGEGTAVFVARWRLDGQALDAPGVALAARAPDLPKDADIEDIKEPVAARRALWPWLLAAALGAAAWEAWRRWGARAPAAAAETRASTPPVPPEVAAERALAELAASGLWERGEHAAYYLALTEILRVYLERRFGEPATAMTSVEVARMLKARGDDLSVSASARELLLRADLVKFARIRPGADDGPRDAAAARVLVRATTPRDLAAGTGAA